MGSGDIVGLRGAEAEVLKAINPTHCMYDIIRREKMVPLAWALRTYAAVTAEVGWPWDLGNRNVFERGQDTKLTFAPRI